MKSESMNYNVLLICVNMISSLKLHAYNVDSGAIISLLDPSHYPKSDKQPSSPVPQVLVAAVVLLHFATNVATFQEVGMCGLVG